MPATEKTWRDQKLMHRIFAASGVILLVATVWMFLADHNREWKNYQVKARNIAIQQAAWQQLQFETEESTRERDRLQGVLRVAESKPIDPALLNQFKEQAAGGADSVDTDALDQLAAELAESAAAANKLRNDAITAAADAEKAVDAAANAQEAAQQARNQIAAAEDRDAAKKTYAVAEANAQAAIESAKQARTNATNAAEEAREAEQEAGKIRARLLGQLQAIIDEARYRENSLLQVRKFKAADLDAAKATLDLAIKDGKPAAALADLQRKIDELRFGKSNDGDDLGLEGLSREYEAANEHRLALQDTLKDITAEVDDAKKALADYQADLERLKLANVDRRSTYFVGSFPFLGKRWLEMPILDAFNSPLKIQNLWDEDNKIDYNFAKVRRFDRCTTCHLNMDKTLPGSATEPAYVAQRSVQLILTTPDQAEVDKLSQGELGAKKPLTLEDVYGIRLAGEGEYLLDRDHVTISYVRPFSRESEASARGAQARLALTDEQRQPTLGAELREQTARYTGGEDFSTKDRGGLMVGDVIARVNGDLVRDTTHARQMLLSPDEWGQTLRVEVQRGLPHPYASHPRLDLFVGSLSPHKLETFACTICHEGQGSATAFKWASHSPSTPAQRRRWQFEHGWFDNPHWIFPQYPKRFAEASCIKCHHKVTDLEPSERFPDAPAPKVTMGYDLVRKYGCFGCHEINGWDGPDERVGPDLRLEPNYFAVAQRLRAELAPRMTHFKAQIDGMPADEDLTILNEHLQELATMESLAETLTHHPERNAVRHRLVQMIAEDKDGKADKYGKTLAQASHRLADMLKDVETPGKFRKVGPSLRHVGHKLTADFLVDWVREPKNFRPTTRMPQFFEVWSHLGGESTELVGKRRELTARRERLAAENNTVEVEAVEAELRRVEDEIDFHPEAKFEPIEILGIVTYLRDRTQAFDYVEPPAGIAESTADEMRARGKTLFQVRGCLACHDHEAFDKDDGLADVTKYRPADEIVQGPDLSGLGGKLGHDVGRKWLYTWLKDPSRYHPRTFMPNMLLDPVVEKDADGNEKLTDPVADLVEFLTAGSPSTWQPAADNLTALDETNRERLGELVIANLKESNSERAATQYMENGIPESRRGDLKGPEVELIGAEIGDKQRLLYIGNKSIAKYGCYACHDIPGFEDAKPIGTGLADWGRKNPAQLAFEHIEQYLEGHGHHASHAHDGDGGHKPADGEFGEPDYEFYKHAVEGGHREGFIYFKLREPRSYDYHKTENKRYNERLRMPQFPLSDHEREAIITFVLGLIADPPASKFVHAPDERQTALIEGRQVLEKYNCGGCHILETEKWDISYQPGSFRSPSSATYPFLATHFSPEELMNSATPDPRGRAHAQLVGMPTLEARDALPLLSGEYEAGEFDDVTADPEMKFDPSRLRYRFDLFEPVALDGAVHEAGPTKIEVDAGMIQRRYPTDGGTLAKYLLPHVLSLAAKVDPALGQKGNEAWGWLPPPLIGEGNKVQPDWLHSFLLDPKPIRPAAYLKMPRFNMSPEEATKLVNYFAARDNADYPYQFAARRQDAHLASEEQRYRDLLRSLSVNFDPKQQVRFEHAMNIVASSDGCVKCHKVADFDVQGAELAKAPNLADVYLRLQPEYVRKWIALPNRILPYTGMPENIKYAPEPPFYGGWKQEDIHGTSVEQLDALVDLLMNFDKYSVGKNQVTELVNAKAPPMEEAPPATGSGESGGPSP